MKDKTAVRLLTHNPLLMIVFFAIFPVAIALSGYFNSYKGTVHLIEGWTEDFGGFWEIYSVAITGIYIFLFFMFFAFEYINMSKSSGIIESSRAISGGSCKLYKSQYYVLTALSFIEFLFAVIFFIYGFFRWKIEYTDYIWYAVKFAFINVFLVSLLASTIGMIISLALKRIPGYFCMLIISVFEIVLFKFNAAALVSGSYGKKGEYAFQLINIFTDNTDRQIVGQYGFSAQPYRAYVLLFWIFLAVFALVLFEAIKSKHLKKYISSAVCAVLAAVFAFTAAVPSSRVCLNSEYMTNSITGDFAVVGAGKTEKANFSVLEYDIKLKIREKLFAETTVCIDNDNPGDYRFTLYSDFDVKSVTDEGGKKLGFSRDGCYITIHGNSKNEKLTFSYSGFSYRFFSNSQAVYLPGHLPYYPLPGFLNVLGSDERGSYFLNNQSQNKVLFNVKVSSPLKIFSNLESSEKNVFTGKASSLYLYGGFVDEKTINSVKVVFSYLDGQARPQLLESCIKTGFEKGLIEVGDTVFVGPSVTATASERIMLFDDGCYLCNVMCFDAYEGYANISEPLYY